MALEALKGVNTIQPIVKDRQLPPVQVSTWKMVMAEGASGFVGAAGEKTGEALTSPP